MKTCSKCKRELPLSHFKANKRSADGHNYQCVYCQREYNKKSRSRNKLKAEHIRNAQKDTPKVCAGCKRTLPRNNFWKSGTNPDGLDCYCRTCSTAMSKKSKNKIADKFDPTTFDWSGTKKCSKCSQLKPKDEFKFNKQSADYLTSQCKSCCKQFMETTPARISQMVSRARKRAKDKNLDFNLTNEYVTQLLPSDMKCPILGITMEWGAKSSRTISPSLDRRDPGQGYIKGNVAIVSNRANAIKNDATVDELNKVLNWLSSAQG